MPRAIWTGTVGFGLVQIPVKAGDLNRIPEQSKKKSKPAPAATVIDLAELLAKSVAASKKPTPKKSA